MNETPPPELELVRLLAEETGLPESTIELYSWIADADCFTADAAHKAFCIYTELC